MDDKVLVTAHYTSESLTELKLKLPVRLVQSAIVQPTLEEISDASALLIRSQTPIHKKLLQHAPKLKVIVTATTGYDHIDLKACEESNIKVYHTPLANQESAAELTLLLMLNLYRKISENVEAFNKNHWRKHVPRGLELKGKHLGIIGLGRIGSRVAELANAFGMIVSAYDPYIPHERFKDLNVEALGLTEVFLHSDIISLHVPLTNETRHLINHQTLKLFSPDTALINTSRGSVVDENELILALEGGHILGAALDVFEKEPLPKSSRLRTCPNIFLTTHLGAYTKEAHQRSSQQAVRTLIQHFKGPDATSQPQYEPTFPLPPL